MNDKTANSIKGQHKLISQCKKWEDRNMNRQMEILCIGNELLIGKIVNTNASWLAKRSTSLGMMVKRIVIVGDEISEIAANIRETLKRKPRFIITTGGLGPTFDDKTLQGIAEALHLKLEVNQEALNMVKEKYEAYLKEGRMEKAELTPSRVKMATLPERAEPLPNPVGTAPGVMIKSRETLLIALPGVPPEMESIFNESIAPILKKEVGKTAFFETSIYADDIMESTLAPLIDQTMHNNPNIYIKSHPKGEERKPHIEIHLSTTAEKSETAKNHLRKATTQLSELIRKKGGKIKEKP